MAYTMEERMIYAHQRGREWFSERGDLEMVTVIRHARRLFSYENEREAFIAGYVGESRRKSL